VSPDAEAQLGPIFEAASTACTGAKKIRKRDFDSCLLQFFSGKVDDSLFGDLASIGAGAVEAYVANGGDATALAILGAGVLNVGTVFLYLSFGKFQLSNYIPQVLRFPAAQINPSSVIQPSTSSSPSSTSALPPPPFFTGLTHMDGGMFDTVASGVMATVLEARWDSAVGTITAAPAPSSTTASTNCICTSFISPSGSNLECPIADPSAPPENCAVSSVFVIPPQPTTASSRKLKKKSQIDS
jgi:hypothetical protein